MVEVKKIITQDEYDNALMGETDFNKKVIKLGALNELAYEGLICSINTNSSVGEVPFQLVRNTKNTEFSESHLIR